MLRPEDISAEAHMCSRTRGSVDVVVSCAMWRFLRVVSVATDLKSAQLVNLSVCNVLERTSPGSCEARRNPQFAILEVVVARVDRNGRRRRVALLLLRFGRAGITATAATAAASTRA